MKIFADSLQEALKKARQEYGAGALIEEAFTENGKVTITVIPSETQSKPVTVDDIKFKDKKNPSLIRSIQELCDHHLIDSDFCSLWLENLENALKDNGNPLFLSKSLSFLLSFNESWLEDLASDAIVVLIGPNGAGKTSVMAKMAVMLLSKGRDLQSVNLDTFRAGAVEQVDTYMRAMDKIAVHGREGWKNCLKQRDSIILVDTPGVNPRNDKELNDLDSLLNLSKKTSNKLAIKFALVLPAFLNGPDAKELAQKFAPFAPEAMIITFMDQASCLGSFIMAAHFNQYPLTLFSKSAKIADALHPLSSQTLVELMG